MSKFVMVPREPTPKMRGAMAAAWMERGRDNWNEVWTAAIAAAPPVAAEPVNRQLLAELYQVLGALDAPAYILDQVSAAANGDPLPHETVLPFLPEQRMPEKLKEPLALTQDERDALNQAKAQPALPTQEQVMRLADEMAFYAAEELPISANKARAALLEALAALPREGT